MRVKDKYFGMFGRSFAFLLCTMLILSVVYAADSATEKEELESLPSVVADDVDTLIIVNKGEESKIDAAIASSISHDIGIPVLYVDKDVVSDELVRELKNGMYKDVRNVVILGGESVVSSIVENSLQSTGETLSGGFDVTRIAGVTGTGTALEAINYFYGPEVVDEVSLVKYEGDLNKDYDEVLHLSAQLDNPIIPIPADVDGLPADVLDSLLTLKVDSVNVVGEFDNAEDIKSDLFEIKVGVTSEISGNNEEIKDSLEEDVKNSIVSGDKIFFIEEGEMPPIVSGDKIFYYKDENNDNLDDESGSVLDGIGRGLYNNLKDKGINIKGINYYGDDKEKMEEIRKSLEREGINVEAVKYDEVEKIAIDVSGEEVERIVDKAEKGREDMEKNFEAHKGEFEKNLPSAIKHFKAFYINEKDKLSAEEIKLGASIIGEESKNDPVAQWKLMKAFANEYDHRTYVSDCQSDPKCVGDEINFEMINIDDKLEYAVGIENADEAAKLDVGEKVELLDVIDFVSSEEKNEVSKEVSEILQSGTKLEDLSSSFVERRKDEAYQKYFEELKKEYDSVGNKYQADKLKVDDIKDIFDDRLVLESEAYLAGLVNYNEFKDPSKRAEIYSKMAEVGKELEQKGIKESQYMSPEDWKNAYDRYDKNGQLSQEDISRYGAAVTAYKTYEYKNPGEYYSPSGGSWDAKTGQYSYTSSDGRLVTGVYRSGYYYYNDEEGNLVEGGKDGKVNEYDSSTLPSGWSYDSKTGVYSKDGVNYIPPSEYNSYSGKYEYYKDGNYLGCGSSGCSEVSVPEGYERNPDGSYSRAGYNGAVNNEWKPGTYYDPKYGGYIPALDSSGAGSGQTGYSGSYGGKYADPYGNAWTQGSDGTWKQSGGSGTNTGATNTQQAAVWTQSADGTWSSSTGQTYNPQQPYTSGGAYNPSTGGYVGSTGTQVDSYGNTWTQGSDGTWASQGEGTSSGSYSGGSYSSGSYSGGAYSSSGSYSGGDAGSYSGGTSSGSYSGGSTGGSTGGDGGGGGGSAPSAPTGGVIFMDSETATKGFLLRWLRGNNLLEG